MPSFKRFKTKYPGVNYIIGTSIHNGKEERIYYFRYRKDGKQIEEKAGRQFQDDMTPARAAKLRALRLSGEQLSNKERREEQRSQKNEIENRWTMNRLFKLFIDSKSHLKSLKDDRIRYNLHLKPILGEKEVDEISSFDVERIRIPLLKTHKPATVKQVLVLLKRLINHGKGKRLCGDLNFKIEMPKVDNAKTEDLSPEQLQQLLKAIETDHDIQAGNIMKMALFTGMRRSEIFRLQWSDINFRTGFITLRDTKGGKSQTIPLNNEARKILENYMKTKSPYVFPGKDGNQINDGRISINRIKQRAGLPNDFRPLHGLRHVYASMLASSGQVDMYTLQKLLTHKSPLMTQRYAHLRDDTLKRASNLMGDLVEQAVNGGQDKKVVNLDDFQK
ncbi:tyrosine-type recombinase/integrase [Candidatus Omnitrophota bacterium]